MERLVVIVVLYFSFPLALVFMAAYLMNLNNMNLVSALFFFGLGGISLFLLRFPTRNEIAKVKEPHPIEGANNSDVWVLVGENTLYLPWYNAISKMIGPCRLIKHFPIIMGPIPRLIILPKGKELNKSEQNLLHEWVKEGVSLLCEAPGNELSNLTGLRNSGKSFNCAVESLFDKSVDLKGAVASFYSSCLDEKGLENKKQIFFENKIGFGFVYTISVEYGKWFLDITQGKPNGQKGRFTKGLNKNFQGIQTPDLRTDKPHPYCFTPVVDVFDHTLLGYILDKLRIPGWWYYPGAKSSAFVLTFDEDWFGDKIKKFPISNVPATWFLVDDSDYDKQSVARLNSQGHSSQFHWNRFAVHLNKFGWHFCLRDAKEQVTNIFKKTGIKPYVCRLHYLKWDSDFDNLFFVMKDAGIKIDSSFGPGRGQHGYRFGTGFPYFVSSKEGKPIGIEEIPFQIHEPVGGSSFDEAIKLLEDSEMYYHTAIVGLFHPYYCLPGEKSYDLYNGLIQFLDGKSVWCTNIEGLSRFWEKRRNREITSEFKGRDLVIHISDLQDEQMTLQLPDAKSIQSLILDDIEIHSKEKVVLSSGEHTVIIKYEAESGLSQKTVRK